MYEAKDGGEPGCKLTLCLLCLYYLIVAAIVVNCTVVYVLNK